MTLRYSRNDELPAWQGTVTINGVAPDLSSGWTFTVRVAVSRDDAAVLTKTTGITGATGGVFTVAWAANDLDIAPGNYVAICIGKRTSDNAEFTVIESLNIGGRSS